MNQGKILADGEEVDNISTAYFDQENFVIIKSEQEIMSGEMKGQTTFQLFSDYDETKRNLTGFILKWVLRKVIRQLYKIVYIGL